MNPPAQALLLASASPRRRELLAQIGVSHRVEKHTVDERRHDAEAPEAYVQRLAREKARDVAGRHPGAVVLGADTVVIRAGKILGKPQDQADARQMLLSLSGTWHQVASAVTLWQGQREQTALSLSEVQFRELTEAEIQAYWSSGEPRDKAGAYAIQGLGALFVRQLRGSYSGVMGLPIYETAALLQAFAVPTALELESVNA